MTDIDIDELRKLCRYPTPRGLLGAWYERYMSLQGGLNKTIDKLESITAERDKLAARVKKLEIENARLKDVAPINFQIVADAVAEAINNADGRISAAQLEYQFMKAGLGVFGMPDDPSMAVIEVDKLRVRIRELEVARRAVDQLQELLTTRDNFIVASGLWSEFCDMITKSELPK